MFTAVKLFFRLPWFLWVLPLVAASWFAWDNFQTFDAKTAQSLELADAPFTPDMQSLSAFDPAALPADGAVRLTAEIDWDEYYELSSGNIALGEIIYGYMLFVPGTREVAGFAYFPSLDETTTHAHIDAMTEEAKEYSAVATLSGAAQIGHPRFEAEVRDLAASWDLAVAEELVFLDMWPEGYGSAVARDGIRHFVLAGWSALAAGASLIMLIISLGARLVFGKRNKLDPTQLEEAQPDTFARKARRAGTAYGAAKSAGDFALGGRSDGPSLGDAADMGVLDDVADMIGPAGAVLKFFGKGDKRSTPLPEASEPISQRPMGKVSARTAALMAKQNGVPVEAATDAMPADATPAPMTRAARLTQKPAEIGRASCRERVCMFV